MQLTMLHNHRADTEVEYALCFYCQAVLSEKRDAKRTSLGIRNFCKCKETEESCYQKFRRTFR